MKLPFVGGAYKGRSVNMDAQTCINLMVEKDATTPDGTCLVGTPGYLELTGGSGAPSLPIRQLLYPGFGTLTFAVAGDRFYEIEMATGAPVWTRRDTPGDITTTTGTVSMVHSGATTKQILIADSQRLFYYVYSGAPAWSRVTAPISFKSNTVAYLDGRALMDDQNNPGRFYYTNLYDFGTINEFNFSNAEGSPDQLRGIFVDRRQIYLMGYQTTEIWYNSGDVNNPFQRYQGGFIEYGTLWPYTAQRCGNTLYWVARSTRGDTQVVRLADNYQVEVVSTAQIDYILQSSSGSWAYGALRSFWALTYQLDGHDCYVLQSPNITLVFDAATNEWHQWRSGSTTTHVISAAIAGRSDSASDLHFIFMGTTASDGKLYRLNTLYFTDNGTLIQRERVTHHTFDEQDRVRLSSIQLDAEESTQDRLYDVDTIKSPGYPAGSTSIRLTTGIGIAQYSAGRTLFIQLNDSSIHLATITGNDAVDTVNFTEPIKNGAPASNWVGVYDDDTLTIEWSKNGGKTWSSALTRHMGLDLDAAGVFVTSIQGVMYAWRIMVFKLGQARQWTFRFKTSAICRIIWRGLYAKGYAEADHQNTMKHYANAQSG